MIRFYKISLLLLFSFTLVTCTEDDSVELSKGNYLIFGHFYGHCFGEECIEIFKLTDSKLYEDSLDDYSFQSFNFKELSNEKFEAVKDILSFLPSELLAENETFIGCPDCADQGGIYIEYKNGNSVQRWKIDQSKSQIPKYLHPFLDKVNEKISIINNE